jgi:hypothetical protein
MSLDAGGYDPRSDLVPRSWCKSRCIPGAAEASPRCRWTAIQCTGKRWRAAGDRNGWQPGTAAEPCLKTSGWGRKASSAHLVCSRGRSVPQIEDLRQQRVFLSTSLAPPFEYSIRDPCCDDPIYHIDTSKAKGVKDAARLLETAHFNFSQESRVKI